MAKREMAIDDGGEGCVWLAVRGEEVKPCIFFETFLKFSRKSELPKILFLKIQEFLRKVLTNFMNIFSKLYEKF